MFQQVPWAPGNVSERALPPAFRAVVDWSVLEAQERAVELGGAVQRHRR